MHIGMIYGENNPFPPDIRLEKEIKVLCDAGHRITVLTQRIPDNALGREYLIEKSALISRTIIKKDNFLWRQIWHFCLLRINWIPAIAKFIEKEKPEILHVHDFDLVPTTIKIAQRYNLPVIADLHENMPAAHRVYRYNKPILTKLIKAILYNYHLWRRKESRTLKFCAKIIVVVPEAAERLYKYGISSKKIAIVSNTEDDTTFTMPRDNANKETVKYSKSWVALYVGGIGPHRGIDTVIRALPILIKVIPNFRLVVVGARNDDRDFLLGMARENEVLSFVDIIEWLPVEKIKHYILCSKVCLVPHNDFEHTQTTVPHKLFQYMIFKKPVIVSNCRPLARIVKETNAGKIFKANDSVDFAKTIISVYSDPEKLIEIGLNGYIAARGKYSWRNDAKRLTQIYSELQNN